ncbi:hypothetical protein [Anaeroselena agilis]|uniref:Carboxypeptidase regulatory-like domain-containing protein n=1 Tax=Anaeroselena agilis TaxID=3063788 RepID=A0ABU3NX65_9FIRM|nr:hypothetical protein [Selenomonadales bacterium 4137-cl]
MVFHILNSASVTVPAVIANNEIHLDGTCNGFDDIALYGQILDGVTPMVGALVRITNVTATTVVGHTYSGCNGNYMFAIPAGSITTGDEILIEIVGSDRTPAACIS